MSLLLFTFLTFILAKATSISPQVYWRSSEPDFSHMTCSSQVHSSLYVQNNLLKPQIWSYLTQLLWAFPWFLIALRIRTQVPTMTYEAVSMQTPCFFSRLVASHLCFHFPCSDYPGFFSVPPMFWTSSGPRAFSHPQWLPICSLSMHLDLGNFLPRSQHSCYFTRGISFILQHYSTIKGFLVPCSQQCFIFFSYLSAQLSRNKLIRDDEEAPVRLCSV